MSIGRTGVAPGQHESRGIGGLDRMTDEQLLTSYIARREEAVFETLVRRHSARVMGVCRQVLGRTHDAEDAFQATFLVLAEKAGRVAKRESLGPWLHGVAHRIAVRCRSKAARWKGVEWGDIDSSATVREDVDEMNLAEQRRILHEEIDRLSERLRRPILLCYLEGRSNDEAARLVGCPPSTLKERLTRAREILRGRLTRRGLALTALVLLLLMPPTASASHVPPRLLDATVAAAQPVHRRKRWVSRPAGSRGPVRIAAIVAIALAIVVAVAVVALVSPTPARGSWLGLFLEAARNACH